MIIIREKQREIEAPNIIKGHSLVKIFSAQGTRYDGSTQSEKNKNSLQRQQIVCSDMSCTETLDSV